jgi:hypothetical protein
MHYLITFLRTALLIYFNISFENNTEGKRRPTFIIEIAVEAAIFSSRLLIKFLRRIDRLITLRSISSVSIKSY